LTTKSADTLETRIISFLDASERPQDLSVIVDKFAASADEASIKAALLSLNVAGHIDITSEWEFQRAATETFE
jgi:hypothetical protein